VKQEILSHEYSHGLTLVAQRMPWLESAAFSLLVPAGNARDPSDRLGLSSFTCEMVQRGCGARDSRQFVEDLELLGVDTSASVSNAHTSFSGAMPAESLFEALSIYADVVQRPQNPADQLEDARQVCLQEIRATEDDLAQRVMIEMRRRRYPEPFGRNSQGTYESVEAISRGDVERHFDRFYRPVSAILSVAGKLDWDQLREHVEACFGDWDSNDIEAVEEKSTLDRILHLPHESSQTHISVSYPSVPYDDDRYFQARGAVGILSDGMSSRLFTEIRENRGLCYAVHASCHSLKGRGSVICYAGTTTERAQETLDVLVAELQRLSEGIQADELDRLKSRIKSALILQQESSTARSGSIAADWYYLSRVRSLHEIAGIIDGLSCESINHYLADHPPADFAVVTLGAEPLEMPSGIS
jgi:predicted Zn-dependent peptidase